MICRRRDRTGGHKVLGNHHHHVKGLDEQKLLLSNKRARVMTRGVLSRTRSCHIWVRDFALKYTVQLYVVPYFVIVFIDLYRNSAEL